VCLLCKFSIKNSREIRFSLVVNQRLCFWRITVIYWSLNWLFFVSRQLERVIFPRGHKGILFLIKLLIVKVPESSSCYRHLFFRDVIFDINFSGYVVWIAVDMILLFFELLSVTETGTSLFIFFFSSFSVVYFWHKVILKRI
jgi:hypothetical protein